MKQNIYLRALEIGYQLGNNGISFNEIFKQLEDEGYDPNKDIFRSWYYLNYENIKRRENQINPIVGFPIALDNGNHPLCSDSFMQYIEYLELKEARETSAKAIKYAKHAIYISVIAMVLNILFYIIDWICN